MLTIGENADIIEMQKNLGGFTMRCKITRRKEKVRSKVNRTLFKELEKLNPKRNFSMNDDEIHVDTDELWKLNLPENCEICLGKNEAEFKKIGFDWIVVEYQKQRLEIYSW